MIAISRSRGRALLAGALMLNLAVLVGCQSAKMPDPMRAVWVTRMDYRTPEDVTNIMENCSSAGFNTVLFQVRGNGTVFYNSKIEPWAEQFDFQNPGFDPLALAIQEAHNRNLQIHAWVNVMPAWQGPKEPSARAQEIVKALDSADEAKKDAILAAAANQLYYTHPDWFWYDADGDRQPLDHVVGEHQRGWYVSLNPCLPEVRAYLVSVFKELVTHYDVDGLHMDYIRFPNEPVVPGEEIPDYPRDQRTLELFASATGETPESNPEAWNAWRTARVTELVGDIHAMMRRNARGKALSASVGAVRANGLRHYQDGEAWMTHGYVDAVFLMNYTPDPQTFNSRIDPWLAVDSATRVVPGMMVRRNGSRATDIATCEELINTARRRTGDFCIFAYSSIFGRGQRRARAADDLRPELVDYLDGLADTDGN
ncbi:MAG TPA: family 10 glycosylhydrolase [Phycisphaerae bacterium]|nr:family 10 glycosylhydrolase [Phycisphaerales bacterium]HRX87427.1 family 10 glycosylhydrolase [Phycisphaerae bacterium]